MSPHPHVKRLLGGSPGPLLCAVSMKKVNSCVFFTDLQALKQLYEVAAEHWHRRAQQKRHTQREG